MTASSAIVLCKGPLSVGIAPAAGGSLTHLDVVRGGQRYAILRRAIAAPVRIAAALNMASFPMIPYAGRLRAGRFEFEGRSIVYPLNAAPEIHSSHGDGFTREWHLTELGRERAVLELSADEHSPVQFECTQIVTVTESCVAIDLHARNRTAQPIPFEVGLHPYFAGRNEATVSARLPLETRWDEQFMPLDTIANVRQAEFAGGMAARDLPIAAEYGGWDGHASIAWPGRGLRVQLSTDPPLHHVVVWAPEGEDFFCFEPASHSVDSFNRHRLDPTLVPPFKLLPGESRAQRCSFIVQQ